MYNYLEQILLAFFHHFQGSWVVKGKVMFERKLCLDYKNNAFATNESEEFEIL